MPSIIHQKIKKIQNETDKTLEVQRNALFARTEQLLTQANQNAMIGFESGKLLERLTKHRPKTVTVTTQPGAAKVVVKVTRRENQTMLGTPMGETNPQHAKEHNAKIAKLMEAYPTVPRFRRLFPQIYNRLDAHLSEHPESKVIQHFEETLNALYYEIDNVLPAFVTSLEDLNHLRLALDEKIKIPLTTLLEPEKKQHFKEIKKLFKDLNEKAEAIRYNNNEFTTFHLVNVNIFNWYRSKQKDRKLFNNLHQILQPVIDPTPAPPKPGVPQLDPTSREVNVIQRHMEEVDAENAAFRKIRELTQSIRESGFPIEKNVVAYYQEEITTLEKQNRKAVSEEIENTQLDNEESKNNQLNEIMEGKSAYFSSTTTTTTSSPIFLSVDIREKNKTKNNLKDSKPSSAEKSQPAATKIKKSRASSNTEKSNQSFQGLTSRNLTSTADTRNAQSGDQPANQAAYFSQHSSATHSEERINVKIESQPTSDVNSPKVEISQASDERPLMPDIVEPPEVVTQPIKEIRQEDPTDALKTICQTLRTSTKREEINENLTALYNCLRTDSYQVSTYFFGLFGGRKITLDNGSHKIVTETAYQMIKYYENHIKEKLFDSIQRTHIDTLLAIPEKSANNFFSVRCCGVCLFQPRHHAMQNRYEAMGNLPLTSSKAR